jgi:CDP-4-dehydro-6-deoxyglucose reductase
MGTTPLQGDRTRYRARLVEVKTLTATTKHFTWEVTSPRAFTFTAGQFISLHLEHNGSDDVRAYSLASAPSADNRFDLCLNRVPGGPFSNYLCDLAPGAQIEFEGPFGFFVPREPLRDSVFIATGTGIAPIRGMLQAILRRRTSQEFWLVFGVRYPETILYREEFEALGAQCPNFHFWPTLSRASAAWPGRRGYVQEHVEALVKERPQLDAYICGLKAMVDDMRRRLKAQGLERKQIRYEKYD